MNEDPGDILRVFRVHGKALAAPVAGATQFLELLNNDTAVLLLPLPDLLQKLFAPKIVAMLDDAFLLQRPLYDRLRSNPCMVCSWQPEHFKAFHPCLSGKNVLDGIIKNVPECQYPRHIWRRNYN